MQECIDIRGERAGICPLTGVLKDFLGNARRSAYTYYRHPGLLRRVKQLPETPVVDGDQFVFIAGVHRSGSTILHQLLRGHSDVSGFENTQVPRDEGQFLQTVFERDSAYGGPGRMAFDPRAHLTEDSRLVSSENRDKLLRQWGVYFDFDKTRLVEKSPANIIATRFLQALFPGARIVAIIRHPITVGLSTHQWTRHNGVALRDVFAHWAKAHELFVSDMAHLRRCHIVRYEDLIADTAETLERAYAFMGLPFQPPTEPVRDENRKSFAAWEQSVSNKDEIIGRFDDIASTDLLETFGYRWQPPYHTPLETQPGTA